MSDSPSFPPLTFPTELEQAYNLNNHEIDQCLANKVQLQNTDNKAHMACQIPMSIGLFFDGTNNNRDRDEPDRGHSNVVRLYNLHPTQEAQDARQREGYYSIYVPGLGTTFQENEEFKESVDGKAFGKGGQARILYGVIEVFNRIYAIFNRGNGMYDRDEVANKLKDFKAQVETQPKEPETPRMTRDWWLQALNREMGARIEHIRGNRLRPPFVPEIFVSVFGFSRGSAEAVAFCHWLNAALPGGQIAGMPVRIGFLGIFDCVASVGISDCARRVKALSFADGHFAWAAEIRKPLPSLVQRTVHMMAAHEQRLNFPVTRVRGKNLSEYLYPGVHSDVGGGYDPGTQGRSPKEDSLLSQIPLIHMYRHARIAGVPLMHPKIAPKGKQDFGCDASLVQSWNKYMASAKADFANHTNGQNLEDCRDFDALYRQHMRLFYDARARYIHPGPNPETGRGVRHYMPRWFDNAELNPNPQHKEDLMSYNLRLASDVLFIRYVNAYKKKHPTHSVPWIQGKYEIDPVNAGTQINYALANCVLNSKDYEGKPMNAKQADRFPPSAPKDLSDYTWAHEFALPLLERKKTLQPDDYPDLPNPAKGVIGDGHVDLITKYAHDSLASFYLVGYSTLEDKSEAIFTIVQKHTDGKSLTPYEKKVLDRYQEKIQTNGALKEAIEKRLKKYKEIEQLPYFHRDEVRTSYERGERIFKPSENKMINASGVIPEPLTDAQAEELLEHESAATRIGIHFVTDGRREGGGYLLPRMVFQD